MDSSPEDDALDGYRAQTRLHVDAGLDDGAVIEPDQGQQHYLLHVMRLGEGDTIAVFNGRDGEWSARLEVASRKSCRLVATRRLRGQTTGPDLWLLFAPVKKARLDFIAQKASELGCSRIWPVRTRHCQVSRVNEQRMRANAVEAAEQTGRLDVARVMPFTSLDEALGEVGRERALVFCDEASAGEVGAGVMTSLAGLAARTGEAGAGRGAAGAKAAILVGPEGGFSRDERQRVDALDNSLKLSLGPRILRSDTAAIAALSCYQAICGDWTW